MVTLVIANGLRHGARAALVNIAVAIGMVAFGLASLTATVGYWFDRVRFAGATYRVRTGIKLIRSGWYQYRLAAAAQRVFPAKLCGAVVESESRDVLWRRSL
jgi:threonine/homoserine/homoserine lactone efflux protein